jgi:catechol 2,3-dioxygenase-like lactoylglutathione lyase family enzyme
VATSIQAVISQLPSTDLLRTRQFYLQHFDCQAIGLYPDFLLLKWDEVEIHFFLTNDPALAHNSSCYVRLTGIDAFYARCSAAGIVHPNSSLQDRYWGMREFHALDPDGNLLKFGQALAGE